MGTGETWGLSPALPEASACAVTHGDDGAAFTKGGETRLCQAQADDACTDELGFVGELASLRLTEESRDSSTNRQQAAIADLNPAQMTSTENGGGQGVLQVVGWHSVLQCRRELSFLECGKAMLVEEGVPRLDSALAMTGTMTEQLLQSSRMLLED